MLVKTDVPGYLKDISTGVVINNNIDEYHKMKAARAATKRSVELCKRMDVLESELKTIKHMLIEIINGKDK